MRRNAKQSRTGGDKNIKANKGVQRVSRGISTVLMMNKILKPEVVELICRSDKNENV